MAVARYDMGSIRLSKNFLAGEFRCPCGCGEGWLVDEQLVEHLQKIRDHFGRSVKISSGYRCPAYNAKIGGSTRSYHSQGRAADIWIEDLLHNPREIARYAESIGIKGIGLYEGSKGQWFVHIDTREKKTFWESHEERIVSTFQEAPREQLISVELRVLKKGCKGPDVEAMQRLLNAGLDIDGSFGGATQRALKAYQAENGLESDGSCGPATWKHLLGRV